MNSTIVDNFVNASSFSSPLENLSKQCLAILIEHLTLPSFVKIRMLNKSLREKLAQGSNGDKEPNYQVHYRFFKREALHAFCPLLFDASNNPFV